MPDHYTDEWLQRQLELASETLLRVAQQLEETKVAIAVGEDRRRRAAGLPDAPRTTDQEG